MNEQAIFLAALDIADPAERADFLNRSCNGDPALRRQVEALLAAHERSGAFLDIPALQQMAACGSEVQSSSTDTNAEGHGARGEIDLPFLRPSTKPNSLGRLGHYEVEEVIGRGGYGIVLKAFDERLHRVVAIKVMAPELAATSPARKRFIREARATAAIRHENVISIHAVEDHPIPYLVMDYIAGQTLQQKLDQTGPLEVGEVLQIGHQIASGLSAAHATGLIHRDIKPGNILLENGKDCIKLTDFGLARTADDASLTQSGVIAGTPLYMSPEQARGEVIDQRSDQFSLGSVLYVMCSGRPPFRASTTLAVLKRVAEDQPRPIQEIIPEVPNWLIALIGKLHAKSPGDRFASVQEVADLLGRWLSELRQYGRVESIADLVPIVAKSQEGPQREAGPARARSSRWWVVAAAPVVAFAGLGMTDATGVTNVRGTIIRLFSPGGTLVVKVDDPSVSVRIDGEELVITGTGAKEIRLKPGRYKVQASKDGKVVSQELVTITSNGREVVRISKEAGPTAAIGSADPDRRAAEWVLSVGGTVGVNGQRQEIRSAADLPREPFRLTSVFLGGNTQVSDAGLVHLKECSNLGRLQLGQTRVTDAGLPDLKGLTALGLLDLRATRVTAEGVKKLAAALPRCKIESDGGVIEPRTTRFIRGNWKIVGDVIEQLEKNKMAMILFGSPNFGDGDFTCEAMRAEGDHGLALVVRATDLQNYYYFDIGAYKNAWHSIYAKEAGANWRRIDQKPAAPVPTDRWVKMRLRLRGDSFEAYLDDELVLSGKDDRRLQGYIGLRTWHEAGKYRNLKFTDPSGKVLWEGLPHLPASSDMAIPK